MYRLLIVDDEIIVKKWMSLVFSSAQDEFQIIKFVSNGQQALEVCRSQPVDIVITDMIMPDLGGMEFIQQLRESNMRTQVIVLSNYADFSLAQKSMLFGASEYLLKGEASEEDILSAARRVAKKLAQAARAQREDIFGVSYGELCSLVSGAGCDAAADLFDKNMACHSENTVCLLAFCIDRIRDSVSKTDLFQAEPNNIGLAARLSELIYRQGISNNSIPITDSLILMLAQVPDTLDRTMLSGRIRCAADELPGCSVSVGISGTLKSAKNLREEFSQACMALRPRFYKGPGLVQPCLSPAETERISKTDFRAVLTQCRGAIQISDMDGLREILRELQKNKNNFGVKEIDQIKRLFNQIAEAMLSHIANYYASSVEKKILLVNPMLEIGAMDFFDDLFSWLEELIERCEAIQAADPVNTGIARAIDYIGKNYHKNLTLAEISKVAGFNPNYFCTVFKDYMGKSFNNYLTEVRMDAAKRMLKSDNKSIHLIAELTGYESDSYFIKVFKEHTGKTPNQYRRSKNRRL